VLNQIFINHFTKKKRKDVDGIYSTKDHIIFSKVVFRKHKHLVQANYD